jgi:hypothetical protein
MFFNTSIPCSTYMTDGRLLLTEPMPRTYQRSLEIREAEFWIKTYRIVYRGINNDPVRRTICYHGSAQKSKSKTFIQAWLHIKTPDQYLTLMGCLLNKLPLCACSWQHFFLITWTYFADASGLIELGPSSWTGQESCSWSNTIYLSWICTTAGIHVRHSYSTSSTTFHVFSFY